MKICLDIGVAQLKKYGEELCGDSVEIVRTDDAHLVVVSDGLGSGVKANILSRLTAKTAATMLRMGGHIDEVIDTVARTLPIDKTINEAYSTFSILQIQNNGKLYLVEYDNPRVFIGNRQTMFTPRREERVIAGKKIGEYEFEVDDQDWLVITSDGVLNAGLNGHMNVAWGWDRIGSFIEDSYSEDKSASEWADEIAGLCNTLYGEKPGDDVTVVAVKVRRPVHVTMLIGPPQRKEDDKLVVRKLMEGPGAKVVCGGTTGDIVARVLGRKVFVDVESVSDEVPPVGMLPGIDLVTEGAVTLVRTLEHIKARTRLRELRSRKDGASRLAVLLRRCDSLHIMVGTAANNALHCDDVPAIYAYKHHVIRDLINTLRNMGKQVTEEYF
ncbi:Stage II sporulation protein E [Desulfotomaculum nigrificans CO-1-SRB]|uniref:Stage II sporulation protein E n=1 Tax=Desulfotomaculum nigrificans (strain DSM 14880 / VKM B-2319 / CO-1-SRB) TaxID=868595 RepID=F6B2R2_DESCC|nr:SpoIIE family protein phosphatase [Desulfotomaculum nigrificans]AEF93891.1 Stage II sporulation protein E [Desulfotomaculum nigrificans CO-1-SRB]